MLCNADKASYRHVKITELKGDVSVKLADSANWIKAQKDMVLSQKDEIRTGKNSTAVIVFDEKGSFKSDAYDSIDIYEDTELVLSKLTYDKLTDERETLLRMKVGKVIANARKLEGDSKFEVETPVALVGVRGTKYLVEYRPE